MSDRPFLELLRLELGKGLAVKLVALLWLGAAALLQAYGDRVFDGMQSTLGKKWMLQVVALAVFSLIIALLTIQRLRKKRGVLSRLRAVKGRGYYFDPVIGEPVCPTCTTDELAIPMLDYGGNVYRCNVCKQSIMK